MSSISNVMMLKDPLDILREEHEKCLVAFDKLAQTAKSIQIKGFTVEAFKQIVTSIKFVETEMSNHHEKEEHCLFPLLDKHLYESPNSIRHERREMWQKVHELSAIVKDVEDGRIHGTTIHELLDIVFNVVERFKKHIERENNVIFPMVKSLLSSNEYEQLKQCIARFNGFPNDLG